MASHQAPGCGTQIASLSTRTISNQAAAEGVIPATPSDSPAKPVRYGSHQGHPAVAFLLHVHLGKKAVNHPHWLTAFEPTSSPSDF